MAIAEEVRAQMARRRTSAVRLGAQIGRSQSYMSRRLIGELAFDMDDLEAIGAALDVPISALLGATIGGSTSRYSDDILSPDTFVPLAA